jgi:4-amino-4-deoxy-L-arabinose transferase-like glycosyltransferase
VRDLLRKHLRFFVLGACAALGLRLAFVLWFPAITSDSFVYGDIAKNWLQHGIYGVTEGATVLPTLIRLPGYPAFLVAVFSIFGMDHYRAVLLLQTLVDIGTCFLVADMARRLFGAKAAMAAFLLAALCPFLANYAAAALTETLEIFFTAAALDCLVAGLESLNTGRILSWTGCGLAIGASILLRPDGGLLLIAIGLYLGWLLIFPPQKDIPRSHIVKMGLIVGLVSLAPLIPWTVRNLRTMHEFQPLAPRYANEENDFVPMGFNRWVKTWMADYVSVEEVYWNVPGDKIDPADLPSRAFDSPQQRQETEALLADYNNVEHISPALDARFAALAAQRIHDHPLRYYVWLPLVRVADMWLRPRTGLLPSDTRWWEFNDDPKWSALAISLGVINLLYIGAAVAGLLRSRITLGLAALLFFIILRSIFLSSIENPEPRYMLECYPVVIALAGANKQKTNVSVSQKLYARL